MNNSTLFTLRAFFDTAVATYPDGIFLQYKQAGAWTTRTYAEAALRVRQLAQMLSLHGMTQEHSVALMLDNGPEWVESYLAIAGVGTTVIPMDPRSKAYEATFMLKDSGASLLVTDAAHLPLIEPVTATLPHLKAVLVIDTPPAGAFPIPVIAIEAERGKTGALAYYDGHAPKPETVASIIYTSGTTGTPKGAMLTHFNFARNVHFLQESQRHIFHHTDNFLIILPLFHSFSFTANFTNALSVGATLSFIESMKTIMDDLRDVHPTMLMAVPLLLEKMWDRINAGLKKNIMAQCLIRLGLGKVVGRKVIANLGGKLRLMFTGGAPCPTHVLEGYFRIGVPLVEGYGLTECSPVVSVTTYEELHIGTIGKKLPGLEVRVADPNAAGIGELEVKGDSVMRGYYNNPEATAAAFNDGWLRTGDLVSMDDKGFITIHGRKKALIVNREGKNIYPEEVEAILLKDPCIAEALVIGYTTGTAKGERVACIAVPNMAEVTAANAGVEPEWTQTADFLKKRVIAQSAHLSDYKHPRKIIIRHEPLERTAAQKVRRSAYAGTLNE
ncbi:MAG: acyl--CoA ligase [Kiritimatiellaeota bacterium]|nr:acyl--CoA ligase [Kiritimatiellota bacterium]